MRFFYVAFLFLLLSFSQILIAQNHRYSPGYAVTISGDTLTGNLFWRKNPGSQDSLYYQSSAGSPGKAMAWKEIRYASRSGKDEVYIHTLKVTLDYLDPHTFNIRMQDSSRIETMPLTPVFKGRVLALLVYSGYPDYYFLTDGSNTIQLVQTYRYLTPREQMFYITQVPKYMANFEYRLQMHTFYNFDSDPKMSDLLERTLFQENSLKTLIKKMDSKLISVQ